MTFLLPAPLDFALSSAVNANCCRSPISELPCTGSAGHSPEYVHTQAFDTVFHRMAGIELRCEAELVEGVGEVIRASER